MAAPASRLSPTQRARLRRLVRWSFMGIVAFEVWLIAVVSLPAQAAFWVCTIPCFVSDSTVRGNVQDIWERITTEINPNLGTANGHLRVIRENQTAIRDREDQHARQLGDNWSADLDAVTKTPTEKLQGVSFQDPGPGAALQAIVPGAVPWDDYYTEYLTSADTTLVMLRTSLDALHAHNLQIEDATALERIARLAGDVGDAGTSGKGYLAMDELEVQSALEVARQLQALRSQHALRASIYAVAESHQLGTEARRIKEDEEAGCRRLAALAGGALGAAISC